MKYEFDFGKISVLVSFFCMIYMSTLEKRREIGKEVNSKRSYGYKLLVETLMDIMQLVVFAIIEFDYGRTLLLIVFFQTFQSGIRWLSKTLYFSKQQSAGWISLKINTKWSFWFFLPVEFRSCYQNQVFLIANTSTNKKFLNEMLTEMFQREGRAKNWVWTSPKVNSWCILWQFSA